MKPPLHPRVRSACLVLFCLGALSIYVARILRVYLAQRSAVSSQVEGVERAIRLVPDDAEFPHLLGLLLSATDQDDGRALAQFRQAVALNPNHARYWLDLASVYQVTGDPARQNEAVRSALEAEPGNPEVAAEAAQYFLVDGDSNRAFPLFRQALQQNPEAANSILPLCWRQTQDAGLLLAQVIPETPQLQLAFLRMLAEQKETAAAATVWKHLIAVRHPFPPQLSFFYFDYLLKQHDVPAFDRDWRELAALSPGLQSYLPDENLMVNAGFELPLLNSGFDWRYGPADHVAAGIDDRIAHSGSRSLSLSYDGGPAYEAGWAEFVPVLPNADYEFSAWIKSDNVTTSSGPRIAIVDAFTGANLLLTDDLLDTHPWQEIKGSLRVPDGTNLLAVKIVRAPANTRIRGRVWIDDLRLAKK
ncbi:MAG: hypothetical protein WCA47_00995 [Terriglobales bacterium]